MTETTVAAPIIPRLIVGLGNPGTKYDRTRHNIGFEAIETLAKVWQINLSEDSKFKGVFGEGLGAGRVKIRLLKPTTYMNHSGQAIRAVTDWYKLPPESVLVIYDDMDLPVGKLRLRLAGSAGGQNGMKSAIAHLGTQTFPRLRVGIGSAKDFDRQGDAIGHVLGRFSSQEAEVIAEVLHLVVGAVEVSLKQGVEKAMNLYNHRVVAQTTPE